MRAPPSPPSMYRTAMGEAFGRLAPEVRRFHEFAGSYRIQGHARCWAPSFGPAKILARLMGTPTRDSSGPLLFWLQATPRSEIWRREFQGQRVMASTLSLPAGGALIVERLGAARFDFALEERGGELRMRLVALRFLGIPCPAWLMPEILAHERGRDGAFAFEIHARAPWLGLVARYEGELDLGSALLLTPSLKESAGVGGIDQGSAR